MSFKHSGYIKTLCHNILAQKDKSIVWIATQDYDCEEAPDQLNLQKDESYQELKADKKGWTRVRNNNGDEGLVKTKLLGNLGILNQI